MDKNTPEHLSLYVRSKTRRYKIASGDEIVEAARAEVGRRMSRGASFTDPNSARNFFRDKLSGLQREVFAVAFLDTRNRLIEYAELFHGTIDGAEVHPREVLRSALQHNAGAVIVAHNHPSGCPDPSAADRAVTVQLKQALSLVGIRLLDHVVVGNSDAVSLAARGWV